MCSQCGVDKPIDQFGRDNRRPRGRVARCKSCIKEYYLHYCKHNKNKLLSRQRNYRRKNKERIQKHRSTYLKKNRHKLRQYNVHKYVITMQDLEHMFLTQFGKCAICNISFVDRKTMHIDHDHTTRQIRGLLCEDCNRGLGSFKDNVVFLKSAIQYLSPK